MRDDDVCVEAQRTQHDRLHFEKLYAPTLVSAFGEVIGFWVWFVSNASWIDKPEGRRLLRQEIVVDIEHRAWRRGMEGELGN